MGRLADLRNSRLITAYDDNAKECAVFGHDFIPDFALNGELACGYCRAALALTLRREIDTVREMAG